MIPFLILSRFRCGTHLLASALEKHPEVYCRDEEILNTDFLPYTRDDIPRIVGEVFSKGEKVAGFPLQHSHAEVHGTSRILHALYPDLHVILLSRRNLLAWWVSFRLAIANQVWTVRRPEELPRQRTLTLDVEEMLDAFRQNDASLLADLHGFAGHPILSVTYEMLTDAFETTLESICAFLHVATRPVRPNTLKQTRGDLRAVVSNYDDVKRAIAGSRWSYLLSEFAL